VRSIIAFGASKPSSADCAAASPLEAGAAAGGIPSTALARPWRVKISQLKIGALYGLLRTEK
jgi:hypothetical protein